MTIKVLFHKDSRAHTNRIGLLKDAAQFAVNYFDLAKDQWRVEIYVVDKFEDEKDTVGRHHYCTRGLSKIYIAAKRRSVAAILSTLFHEFTHLKHVVKGDVFYSTSDTALWKSSVIMRKPTTFGEYWNRPDEIDARKHQAIMLRKYAMKRIKDYWHSLVRSVKREATEEQLDWHYNDRRSSNAEMQGRQANMSNPGDKDYDV